jgi:two-component system chemotaxis sensor kinase CheA
MTFDPSVFVGKFVEEARDRLKSLGEALLRLERVPTASGTLAAPNMVTPMTTAAIEEVLRQAHSLKGSALMLGFTDISHVSHLLEDLFVAAKRKPTVINSDGFDVVFNAVDVLSARIEQLARGQLEPVEVGELGRKLKALLGGGDPAPSQPLPDVAKPVAVHDPVHKGPELRQSLRVPVEKLDRLTHLAPELVVQSLKAFERHTELKRLERILSRLRDRAREARLTPDAPDTDRTDQFAEYADTLDVLTRRMRDFLVEFSDDRVRLNLITEELRQNVIELTMLPVATVFDPFTRAVRDLARSFDKEVDLTVRGRDTELDKKIIEQISEPLIHLIRNAVDHGLESNADRERSGKPRVGQLLLSAEQQGNRVLVTLRDDGCGMDPAKLREAAVRFGIASAAELEGWAPEKLFDLIFRPGFSTRASTTDVSGRGVGMDVVRSVVERLGGGVRVQSELGRGTTFTLNLPLSLALLRVVLIEAGDELFAFPTAAVRRILHLEPDDLVRLHDDPTLSIDDEHVPVAPVSLLLRLPSTAPFARQTVLLCETSDGRFGLLVDAVHEEQELVFKELKGPLRNQRTFTGAALLGNGDIVPILDVITLFELVSRAPSMHSSPVIPRRVPARPCRVLVVDDSLVAGELQKNILLAAGYQSEIAQDGVEALDLLGQKIWDLVIADVDMPRMDGFELTVRLRADERYREIPVIIVTSRDSLEDRRRGFEVGADAYVLKREFDQTQLLDTVRRLVRRVAPFGAQGTYV